MLGPVGVPVDPGELEAVLGAPAVARVHLHRLGARVRPLPAERLDDLAGRDELLVRRARVGVQERDHAAERHAVARAELLDDLHPVVEVGVAGDQLEVGGIVGGVEHRVGLRERVALEHERRPAELLEDLAQGAAADLAVVDVDEHVLAVGDHEHRVVGTVLVRRHPHARRELHHLPVRELHHLVEPEVAHLLGERRDAELRHEHVRVAVDPTHRREVEVVEVVVREVDVVGRQHLGRRLAPPSGSATTTASSTSRATRGRRGSSARSSRCAGSCGR